MKKKKLTGGSPSNYPQTTVFFYPCTNVKSLLALVFLPTPTRATPGAPLHPIGPFPSPKAVLSPNSPLAPVIKSSSTKMTPFLALFGKKLKVKGAILTVKLDSRGRVHEGLCVWGLQGRVIREDCRVHKWTESSSRCFKNSKN